MYLRVLIVAALCCSCGLACKDKPPKQPPVQAGGEQPPPAPEGGDGSSTDGMDADAPTGPSLLFDRGTQGPKALHMSERYLYWYESNLGDGARVLYAPKDGSREPVALSPTESLSSFGFLASDSDYVYWVERERVLRMAHGASGAPDAFPLGRLLRSPYLALDGGELFVTDLGCFHIARVSTSDFAVTMLRDEVGEPDGGGSVLVTDERNVYCSSGNLGTIVAVPKAGGAVREVVRAAENHGIAGVVRVDGDLYFLQVPHSRGEEGQSLVKVSASGGASSVLGTAEVNGGGSLLRFDPARRAAYWVDSISYYASLHRFDLALGTLSTVVHEQHLHSDLALDAERLYFVKLDPSGIYTLPL